MNFTIFRVIGASLLLWSMWACSDDLDSESNKENNNIVDQGDTDKSPNESSDTDTPWEDDENVDDDGDGVTNAEGDCNDREPLISPHALEDLGESGAGDGLDNDCDGEIDEDESCYDDGLGKSATELAAAMNLCDSRFLLNAKKVHSADSNFDVAYDTLERMGTGDCLVAPQGNEMAVLSTGIIGQENPNYASSPIDFSSTSADDPQPAYQADTPIDSKLQETCDVTQLQLTLRAPSNATGFSFDFLYASSEYEEWVGEGYNDTFYAIMEYDKLNNGATTNIAFDSHNNEIEVDVNFFENNEFICDETGSGWEPEVDERSGSTGWLRTTWSLAQGSAGANRDFTITFSIHDEGDCIYDSIVFLDNFVWILGDVEINEGTTSVMID